jgi:zinc protease
VAAIRRLPDRVKKDFEALPALPKGAPTPREMPRPRSAGSPQALLIEKQTRSVAFSLGTPLDVKRGDPDFLALLVAQSYLGQHRVSGGRLFDRMRDLRGLNYGDYAYIEYFPRGMFRFEPEPNLARQQQIFQIWIRPVPPEAAHFALRLAMFELDKLIREGLTPEAFERTRSFLVRMSTCSSRPSKPSSDMRSTACSMEYPITTATSGMAWRS